MIDSQCYKVHQDKKDNVLFFFVKKEITNLQKSETTKSELCYSQGPLDYIFKFLTRI